MHITTIVTAGALVAVQITAAAVTITADIRSENRIAKMIDQLKRVACEQQPLPPHDQRAALQ
jgi:hypothetical protein